MRRTLFRWTTFSFVAAAFAYLLVSAPQGASGQTQNNNDSATGFSVVTPSPSPTPTPPPPSNGCC